jgi:hypothetical protein
MGLTTLAAGAIYPVFGAGVFWLGAALSVVGFAAAVALSTCWRGEKITV